MRGCLWAKLASRPSRLVCAPKPLTRPLAHPHPRRSPIDRSPPCGLSKDCSPPCAVGGLCRSDGKCVCLQTDATVYVGNTSAIALGAPAHACTGMAAWERETTRTHTGPKASPATPPLCRLCAPAQGKPGTRSAPPQHRAASASLPAAIPTRALPVCGAGRAAAATDGQGAAPVGTRAPRRTQAHAGCPSPPPPRTQHGGACVSDANQSSAHCSCWNYWSGKDCTTCSNPPAGGCTNGVPAAPWRLALAGVVGLAPAGASALAGTLAAARRRGARGPGGRGCGFRARSGGRAGAWRRGCARALPHRQRRRWGPLRRPHGHFFGAGAAPAVEGQPPDAPGRSRLAGRRRRH
jgi:hypothetical protein